MNGDTELQGHRWIDRRRALKLGAAAGLAPFVGSHATHAQEAGSPLPGMPVAKTVPSTGASVPAVGMGTWITFNVGEDPAALAQRTEVMRAFFAGGGAMIDSSPMYGSSQATVGHGLRQLGIPERLFAADKVWTSDAGEAPDQISATRDLWGIERFGVFQVHNLLGWERNLDLLQAMKEEGRIGHVGVTTSHGRRHADIEAIMTSRPIDFVQLSYSMGNREAEERLLPLAAERGIAVIANRPFQRGALIDRVAERPLPTIAGEVGAESWPQFLLRYVIGHPALTSAIPATTSVEHVRENMAAARGPLPDSDQRRRMAAALDEL